MRLQDFFVSFFLKIQNISFFFKALRKIYCLLTKSKCIWMKRFASDLLCVWAGAGRVVGREKHQAVQEQRHLRVWAKEENDL